MFQPYKHVLHMSIPSLLIKSEGSRNQNAGDKITSGTFAYPRRPSKTIHPANEAIPKT
jgi:hypothetical protein